MKTFKMDVIKNPSLSAAVLFFFIVSSGTPAPAFAADPFANHQTSSYQPTQPVGTPEEQKTNLINQLEGMRRNLHQSSSYRKLNDTLEQITGENKKKKVSEMKSSAAQLVSRVQEGMAALEDRIRLSPVSLQQKAKARLILNNLKPKATQIFIDDVEKKFSVFLENQAKTISLKMRSAYEQRINSLLTQLNNAATPAKLRLALNSAHAALKSPVFKTLPTLPSYTVPQFTHINTRILETSLKNLISFLGQIPDARVTHLNRQAELAKAALKEWNQKLDDARKKSGDFKTEYEAGLRDALSGLAAVTDELMNFDDPEASEFVEGDEAFQADVKEAAAAFLNAKEKNFTLVIENTVEEIEKLLRQYTSQLEALRAGKPLSGPLAPEFKVPQIAIRIPLPEDPLAENGILSQRTARGNEILDRLRRVSPEDPVQFEDIEAIAGWDWEEDGVDKGHVSFSVRVLNLETGRITVVIENPLSGYHAEEEMYTLLNIRDDGIPGQVYVTDVGNLPPGIYSYRMVYTDDEHPDWGTTSEEFQFEIPREIEDPGVEIGEPSAYQVPGSAANFRVEVKGLGETGIVKVVLEEEGEEIELDREPGTDFFSKKNYSLNIGTYTYHIEAQVSEMGPVQRSDSYELEIFGDDPPDEPRIDFQSFEAAVGENNLVTFKARIFNAGSGPVWLIVENSSFRLEERMDDPETVEGDWDEEPLYTFETSRIPPGTYSYRIKYTLSGRPYTSSEKQLKISGIPGNPGNPVPPVTPPVNPPINPNPPPVNPNPPPVFPPIGPTPPPLPPIPPVQPMVRLLKCTVVLNQWSCSDTDSQTFESFTQEAILQEQQIRAGGPRPFGPAILCRGSSLCTRQKSEISRQLGLEIESIVGYRSSDVMEIGSSYTVGHTAYVQARIPAPLGQPTLEAPVFETLLSQSEVIETKTYPVTGTRMKTPDGRRVKGFRFSRLPGPQNKWSVSAVVEGSTVPYELGTVEVFPSGSQNVVPANPLMLASGNSSQIWKLNRLTAYWYSGGEIVFIPIFSTRDR